MPSAWWVRGRWQVRVPMPTVSSAERRHYHTRSKRGVFCAVSCSANAWARCAPLLIAAAAQHDEQSSRVPQLRRSVTTKPVVRDAEAASSHAISSYGFDIELTELSGAQSPTAASAAAASTAQERMRSERGAIFGIPTAPNARNRTADGVDEAVGVKGLECYTSEEISEMVLPGSGYR